MTDTDYRYRDAITGQMVKEEDAEQRPDTTIRETQPKMKVFIWEYLPEVTDHYHPEGGLVIVAATQPETYEIPTSQPSRLAKTVDLPAPDAVYSLRGKPEPRVFTFPDSGCC